MFKKLKYAMLKRLCLLILSIGIPIYSMGQGVFPVYSDYLSDNVFLIHPSAAGIGNCAKLRLTARQQFLGLENAPNLQTLSMHGRVNDKMAVGGILFNDQNGFHSQQGIVGSYAYHLNFGSEAAMDQLSLGLSFMYTQNSVDQRDFITPLPDPGISQTIESAGYFNADFSVAYHHMDAYSYFTVKNILLSTIDYGDGYSYDEVNLRKYLLTFGYYFGRNNKFQFEPSVMGQFIERTGEIFVDFNMTAYKKIGTNMQLWGVLSYRRSFESNHIENLQLITPIIGFNYKRLMFSYTYTNQIGDVVLEAGGSHQITLGINLFCKRPRSTGCPNLNSIY